MGRLADGRALGVAMVQRAAAGEAREKGNCVGKSRGHAIRAVALALSVLVGFATPLGDSAPAVAAPAVAAPASTLAKTIAKSTEEGEALPPDAQTSEDDASGEGEETSDPATETPSVAGFRAPGGRFANRGGS